MNSQRIFETQTDHASQKLFDNHKDEAIEE